jgi:hypothetical protein
MFSIVLGQHVLVLTESSSGPSKKTDPYLEMLKCAVGSQTLTFLILEGPEDDSVRIETCCPNTIINTIKVCCV